jgi:hypothetical protein
MDTTAMNKDFFDEVWVDARKSLLGKESLPSESDEAENQRTVTRIFHGLYVSTTKRY